MDERRRCVVVCTDETGRYDAIVDQALDRAASDGARVILYDVSAAGSAFSEPRPNRWAGEGQAADFDHPLDPVALEELGRHALAVQVQSARDRGIDAYGWLPEKATGSALADYAARQQADLVIVPTDLDQKDIDAAFANGGVQLQRI